MVSPNGSLSRCRNSTETGVPPLAASMPAAAMVYPCVLYESFMPTVQPGTSGSFQNIGAAAPAVA